MCGMASSTKDTAFAAVDSGFTAVVGKALAQLQDNLIADPTPGGRQLAQDRFTVALKAAVDARTVARSVVDTVVTG
jgi:hypothetical protein